MQHTNSSVFGSHTLSTSSAFKHGFTACFPLKSEIEVKKIHFHDSKAADKRQRNKNDPALENLVTLGKYARTGWSPFQRKLHTKFSESAEEKGTEKKKTRA